MTDPHKPSKPDEGKQVIPDVPETEAPVEVPTEGQLPGMPVSSDPLLQPMPHPQNREVPPID